MLHLEKQVGNDNEGGGDERDKDSCESSPRLELLVPCIPEKSRTCLGEGGSLDPEDLLGEQPGGMCLACVQIPCTCLLVALEARLEILLAGRDDRVTGGNINTVQEDEGERTVAAQEDFPGWDNTSLEHGFPPEILGGGN